MRWVARQSLHLAAVPLEEPAFAAAHAKALPVPLMLPKEQATLPVPIEREVPEPSMLPLLALQQVREVV